METARGRARAVVDDALNEALDAGASAFDLGQELFALVEAIESHAMLRRTLTEPSIPAGSKREMLHSLLGEQVSAGTLTVADASVGNRWGKVSYLADSLERAAVTAYAAYAQQHDALDDMEDDLFRFQRILEANWELLEALADSRTPVQGRRELLHSLLRDKVGAATLGILDHVTTGRSRSPVASLEHFQKVVAQRRNRLVATVTVAAPLSEEHHQRLNDALAREFGQGVRMNVVVDPRVLGGVRVLVGDEVIDSTALSQVADLQRRPVR